LIYALVSSFSAAMDGVEMGRDREVPHGEIQVLSWLWFGNGPVPG